MILKSPSSVSAEIEQTDRLIRSAGVDGEIFFRPPYGKKLFVLPWYLSRNHRVSVTWDVAPDSTRGIAGNHRLIAENALKRVRPGSIILLHPWYESRVETRRAIPLIIEGLQERGFRLVTVSELLSRAGISEARKLHAADRWTHSSVSPFLDSICKHNYTEICQANSNRQGIESYFAP